MSVFKLPDLGEGLQEAEIAQWHVAAGAQVEADQPLVSVETDKALVEIPSPQAGTIRRVWGRPGDVLPVGAPLVEFENGEDTESTGRVEGSGDDTESTGGVEGSAAGAARGTEEPADSGSVVGRVEASGRVANEAALPIGRGGNGVKATPAVRALARRMDVDLSVVTPTGPNDTITSADVQRVARIFDELGPLEPLRGVRRAMARSMTQAHAEVVPVTVNDDADIAAWGPDQDIMLRLIRAIAAGCRAEPGLNVWYDSHAVGRRVLDKIDLGIAVDTPDGLFVPVLRDVGRRTPDDLRRALDAIKRDVRQRTIPPEEMRGNTFTLSNFGTFGGRYADPVVVPPTVAILGAGRIRDAVVAVDGAPAVHRTLPLSLTFDHRSVTGGEATRFLAAAMEDLALGR